MLTLLEADPRRKQIEVLIASRNASEDVVRQTIEFGISDYLLKPLQYDWVIQRLRAAAERVRERRGAGAGEPADSLKRILVADSDANFAATVEAAVLGVVVTLPEVGRVLGDAVVVVVPPTVRVAQQFVCLRKKTL